MSELRQDVTTRDWVVVAPERASRPHDPPPEPSPAATSARAEHCPFCPGNEAHTPPEVDRLPPGTGPWRVRTVPNRFPVLGSAAVGATVTSGLFPRQSGAGAHEVVIEGPTHDRALPDMSEDEVVGIFEMYQRRARALGRLSGIRSVVIFKNHGERAGTSLRHPHSQIIAAPVATPLARRRSEVTRAYYGEHRRCLYCDLRESERAAGERVVLAHESVVAIQPYASRWPYETWIIPAVHAPSFVAAGAGQLRDVAGALGRLLRAFRAALDDPPYNYVVQSVTVGEDERPSSHWYVQIAPRLGVPAGFELGSGMTINPVPPEEAAAVLRARCA